MQSPTDEVRPATDDGSLADKIRTIRSLLDDVERVVAQRSGGRTGATGSYISKTPGVCGGDACVRKTRIPVWLLVSMRRHGYTQEDLLSNYPGLSAVDLDVAWSYYQDNSGEIEAAIAAQDEED